MRQFLTIFFACLLAILFAFFIAGISLIGMASLVGKSTDTQTSPTKNSLLRINSSTIVNSIAPNDIESVLQIEQPNTIILTNAIHSIQKAATDNNISAILLELNNCAIPAAYRNEIIAALDSFKKSGKKVYAYGTIIDQGSYDLATAADNIYMHPRGFLLLLGYSADVTFYKGLMDKMGIEPQIFYAGNFKSATEPFRLKKMSEPNRLQISELLDDFWKLMIDRIANKRNLTSTQVSDIINKGEALLPNKALENKLIDSLLYQDELTELLSKKLGWSEDADKEKYIISLLDYNSRASSYGSDQIALLNMSGEITGVFNPYAIAEITAEEYLPIIEKLEKNKKIKAIVLHINSPGGDAIVSDKIWHAIQKLNKTKPVVAYMSSVAASGGYYIAAAAREIIAQPHTITGSIGVYRVSFNAKKLFENKIGLSFDKVKRGELADFGSINREMTAQEKQLSQEMVNHMYDRFIEIVQKGRNLSMDTVRQIAQGRVYSGEDALEIGLVDKMGLLSTAIKSAAKYANIEEYKIKEYPQRDNPINAILKSAQASSRLGLQANPHLELWFQELKKLNDINGKIMARTVFDLHIQG